MKGQENKVPGQIGRVLRDGALRGALGRGARQLFSEKFSAAELVRALGTTYADLGFCA